MADAKNPKAEARAKARAREDAKDEMDAKVEEGAARGVKINPMTGEEEGPLPTAHQSSEASMGPAPHLPLNVPSTENPPPPDEETPPADAAQHGEQRHAETPQEREARARREREEALKHQHGG
jgi:hypothetical protein